MTELLNDRDTPSDAELISSVRGGDVTAYGVLFSRHREAANRLARQLVRGPDADDLTSEAFAKVLGVLQRGGGPDVSFRAYLLTAVRRLHVARVRSGKRLQTTDDMTPFDPGVPFQDTTVAAFENAAAAKAFASLPERWQLVLWHLEVEGQKPADIAPLLGMSANSVSALAYRAREGLRQAFLTMHLSDISDAECRWVNEHLGAFVRNGLSQRDATRLQTHLDGCRRCTAMHLELTEVNSNLSAIIAPLLLGTAAAGYLASISGAGGALGALSLVGRVKELAAANTGGVVAGAVTLGVATAAAVTFALTQSGGNEPSVVADPPAASTSTPAAPLTSPEATDRPTATRTPSGSSSPPATGASTGTGTSTASGVPSATGTASGLPSGSLTPTSPLGSTGPTGRPSGGAGGQQSGRPSPGGPGSSTPSTSNGPSPSTPGAPSPSTSGGSSPSTSGGPSPSTPGAPSPSTPGAPAPPTRTVDPPSGSDDGTVTVTAHDLRAVDTLTVTMVSVDTTFAANPPTGCRVVLPRLVECDLPRAVEDLTVTLPLDFPAAMVADRLRVTAAVVGVPDATASASWTFEPGRTPTFDFAAPVVGPAAAHRVDGEVDEYDFTTTAVLPPRVQGLQYLLGAGARFRAGSGPCTVTGTSTMTCPDVVAGDQVAIPLQTESLTQAQDVGLSVKPLVDFVDPPADNRTTLRLRPGVDLSLSDPVPGVASPIGEHLVGVRLGGRQRAMSQVTFTIDGAATFVCPPALVCSAKTLTMGIPASAAVTLPMGVVDPLAVTPVDITVGPVPGSPYQEVDETDNTARVRLAPDVALDSVVVTGHRRLAPEVAVARATVSGAPSTLDEIRLAISDTAAGQVQLIDGASGADGEGDVDCYTSDATGAAAASSPFATCTNVRNARDGKFYVELRLAHPHGVSPPVSATFTVRAVGVDEDGRTANNSKSLVIR